MLVDPDEHPSFYKLLFKEDFVDKILMPPAFIEENKSMLAKTCLLKTDEGVLWEAKIVREKCGYFICEGEWPQFVEYHKLKLGNILLFFLIDKSTFQVLPYKQIRLRNLIERQVFEELSSSSEEEEEEEEEEDITPPRKSKKYERRSIDLSNYYAREEEDITPPRKSKKRKRHLTDLSDNHARECIDLSSGSKDGESPLYPHSGGKSNAEADNVLHKKKAPGLKLLLKACQEKCSRPANSILGSKLERRGKPRGDRDPEKPKQPISAFFLFMEEFRKQLGEKNPVIHDVCTVGRAGGDKWNQMSEAEKAPYIEEAKKRKVEYKENMRTYCERMASTAASKEEESDKSRSAVEEDVGGN